MYKLILLFSVVCCSLGFNHLPAEECTIEVTINDIRNAEGQLLVSLYKPTDNFPYEPSKSYAVEKSDIVGTSLTYSFKVPQSGRYAVVLLDDENRNNDMDYNFLGIPKEGYGFSNDAKPRGLSSPKFEAAAFDVEETGKRIAITMKYML